jgi:hypothetical protein
LIEMNEIRETTRIEQELGHDVSFFDLFRGTDLRRTILSVLASCTQAGSGINLIVGYGTYFYEVAGVFHILLIIGLTFRSPILSPSHWSVKQLVSSRL